jgi:hypothetical protein
MTLLLLAVAVTAFGLFLHNVSLSDQNEDLRTRLDKAIAQRDQLRAAQVRRDAPQVGRLSSRVIDLRGRGDDR